MFLHDFRVFKSQLYQTLPGWFGFVLFWFWLLAILKLLDRLGLCFQNSYCRHWPPKTWIHLFALKLPGFKLQLSLGSVHNYKANRVTLAFCGLSSDLVLGAQQLLAGSGTRGAVHAGRCGPAQPVSLHSEAG